jgi:hypothetical protein
MELNTCEKKPIVFLGMFIGFVDWNVTFSTKYGSIFFAENKGSPLLKRQPITKPINFICLCFFLLLLIRKKEEELTISMQYLADIADRGFFEGWMEQRAARVLAGELVCVVDAVITAFTESSFICRAEYIGLFFLTDVALDLHYLSLHKPPALIR